MFLSVKNLVKDYPVTKRGLFRRGETLRALNGVSLSVERGKSFGVIGESGSGKSTLIRCILRLENPTSGTIEFDGRDITTLSAQELRPLRARMQIVFQDPHASLNPRMAIRDIITEPLVVHANLVKMTEAQRVDRAVELLELVSMSAEHLDRFPHEFSGGQRQRIGIARALACSPELLFLDEPTSALDVSVQAEVLDLLTSLQRQLGLTYVFISHDLSVVRAMCDDVMIMNRGNVIEAGPAESVLVSPQSDYGRLLLSAVPIPDPRLSPYRNKPQPVAGAVPA